MKIKNDITKRVFVLDPPSQCPLRSLDASKIRNYFTINNYIVSDTIENVDYIIYVTCSVSPQDVINTTKTIKELEKHKAQLIVAGCMPGANHDELRKVFDGPVVATKNIEEIDNFFPDFRIKFNQTPEPHTYNYSDLEANLFYSNYKNYSFITLLRDYGFSETFYRKKIQLIDYKSFVKNQSTHDINDKCFILVGYGCTNNCSYCNIRKAVGKIKSKPIKDIVQEYKNLLEKGSRIFHFLADDISSYGMDFNSSLNELLEALSETDKNYNVKWSLHGMNPGWLVKNKDFLIPYFKSKKIWDITIAIESGSDRIIKLMNRHYKIQDVCDTLKEFRKINPGLRLAGLFFAGFPTETEEDFNDTLNFVKKIKFDNARVTYYYEFDYLPAAKLFPKVSPEETKRRIDIMEKILYKQKTDSLFLTQKK